MKRHATYHHPSYLYSRTTPVLLSNYFPKPNCMRGRCDLDTEGRKYFLVDAIVGMAVQKKLWQVASHRDIL